MFDLIVDYHPEFDSEDTDFIQQHSIQLLPLCLTQRGMAYAVLHEDRVLIAESYDPEVDACRELLSKGMTGKVTTYRGDKACMILVIEKAAQYRTSTDKEGTPIFRKITVAKSG